MCGTRRRRGLAKYVVRNLVAGILGVEKAGELNDSLEVAVPLAGRGREQRPPHRATSSPRGRPTRAAFADT